MSRVVLLNFEPLSWGNVGRQLQRYQSTTRIPMQTHINDPELLGRYPASSLSVDRPELNGLTAGLVPFILVAYRVTLMRLISWGMDGYCAMDLRLPA